MGQSSDDEFPDDWNLSDDDPTSARNTRGMDKNVANAKGKGKDACQGKGKGKESGKSQEDKGRGKAAGKSDAKDLGKSQDISESSLNKRRKLTNSSVGEAIPDSIEGWASMQEHFFGHLPALPADWL